MQRDLGAGFVLQTGYVGHDPSGRHLSYFDANAGFIPGAGANGRPYLSSTARNVSRNFFIPMATNRYDAWQSNVTKRCLTACS